MTALARTTPAGRCDEKTARRLTNQIKKSLELSYRLVHEAFSRGAWAALSYSSWEEYCREEFGSGLSKLAKELRREAVAELASGENPMSNRAIAAALGVDEGTVRNDRKVLAAGAESSAVDPEPEVIDAEVVADQSEPRRVAGIDGKRHLAPVRNTPPARRPLPDEFAEKVKGVGRLAERLIRETTELQHLLLDDRFADNQASIAARCRGDLTRIARWLCQVEAGLRDVVDDALTSDEDEAADAAEGGAGG